MSKKNLVIVESPAKAKTIEKILGDSFRVVASYGHVRDLPKTTLGVKIEENFKPNYSIVKDKKELVATLKDLAKKAQKVYLASDPDREGEAIAWHIAKTLKLDENELNRIEFNEITESAITDSLTHVRKLDMKMVNAQQARRILDRIVGYKISPLLWTTVSEKTSAGRVQSVALKMICDLEDEIRAFIPEKYWNVNGLFKENLKLVLSRIDGKKHDPLMDEAIVEELRTIKKDEIFKVTKANVTSRKKTPPNPLKTSTLQQLSSSYLGFSASKTMRVAQGLYEGLEIHGEQKGLITYMRTDSLRVSNDAVEMTKKYITSKFGENYIGEVREAKKDPKDKKIQDAHEAIRPTEINYEPDSIKKYLDNDQYKLYKLIWDRFLISQMANMRYEQFEIVVSYDKFDFRGSVHKVLFDGYYKIFKEDDELSMGDFPEIKVGDEKILDGMDIKEEWTKAPSRLTESSLVKRLEQEGIGRPSTYASIVETLKKREYVNIEGKSFIPTELGYEIKNELEKNFKRIMNIKFTAHFEAELDEIAEGNLEWTDVLKEFYSELEQNIEKYSEKIKEIKERLVVSDVKCKCSDNFMLMKTGIFGKYLTCEVEGCKENVNLRGINIPKEDIESGKIFVKEQVEEREKGKIGVPTDVVTDAGAKCLLKVGRFGSYLESENFKEDEVRISLPGSIKKMLIEETIKIEDGKYCFAEELKKIKDEENNILSMAGTCEKCGKPFKVNRGRWGKFLSCTGYPKCNNIKKLDKNNRIIEEKDEDIEKKKKTTTKKKATAEKTVTEKTTAEKKVTEKKSGTKKSVEKKDVEKKVEAKKTTKKTTKNK